MWAFIIVPWHDSRRFVENKPSPLDYYHSSLVLCYRIVVASSLTCMSTCRRICRNKENRLPPSPSPFHNRNHIVLQRMQNPLGGKQEREEKNTHTHAMEIPPIAKEHCSVCKVIAENPINSRQSFEQVLCGHSIFAPLVGMSLMSSSNNKLFR